MEREGKPRTDASDVDTIEHCIAGGILESAAQQIHLVTALNDAAKDFMEVQLSAARVRVLPILPVYYENAQWLEHALLARVRVEHPVHEAGALLASVSFGKTN